MSGASSGRACRSREGGVMGYMFERVDNRGDGVLVARFVDLSVWPIRDVVFTHESLVNRIANMIGDGRDTSQEHAALDTMDTILALEKGA